MGHRSGKSYLDDKAIEQLKAVGRLPGVALAVGLPDLHPGSRYPIGELYFNQWYNFFDGRLQVVLSLWKVFTLRSLVRMFVSSTSRLYDHSVYLPRSVVGSLCMNYLHAQNRSTLPNSPLRSGAWMTRGRDLCLRGFQTMALHAFPSLIRAWGPLVPEIISPNCVLLKKS